jgi:hypothetical protein
MYGELCNLVSAASGYIKMAESALVEIRKLLNGGIKSREEIIQERRFQEDFPKE